MINDDHVMLGLLTERVTRCEQRVAHLYQSNEASDDSGRDVVPITPNLIAISAGDDLDVIADRLGLSRKGPPYRSMETDDELQMRCGAALFGQMMARDLAETIAWQAARNRAHPGCLSSAWRPDAWVVDAVMAVAGADPRINQPTMVVQDAAANRDAEISELKAENVRLRTQLDRSVADCDAMRDAHWAGVERWRADHPTRHHRELPLTREQLVMWLLDSIDGLHGRMVEMDTREQGQAATIEHLDAALTYRSQRLETTQAALDKITHACADQAAQIAELRGDSCRAQPLIAAVSEWRRYLRAGRILMEFEAPLIDAYDAWTKAAPETAEPPTVAHEIPTSEPDPLSGL